MIWFNKFIRNKKAFGIFILIMIGLSLFVYSKDPFNGPILPCLFNKVTGLYCPGCGMTRAVNSIFNFKFYQAIRFNALILVMPIPLATYYIARYKNREQLARLLLIAMLIIVIGYGILRNIPAFRYLSPVSL